MTKPFTARFWVKTSATVDPCRALPNVLPTQVNTPVPVVVVPQENASRPDVVVRTATGTTPAATPPGTATVRFHCTLPARNPVPLTGPVPDTCPLTVQTWFAVAAQGTPAWPLVCTCPMACCTVRLDALAVGLGVVRVGLAVAVASTVEVAVAATATVGVSVAGAGGVLLGSGDAVGDAVACVV